MATGIRGSGDFCWINILTSQPADEREFFAKVLGWTYFEMPGVGHGMRVDGRDIGGIFDLDGPNTPPGLSPVIGVMIKVEKADATCEKVRLLGGEARPAFDIGEQGRMSVCRDPSGCAFDIWEPRMMPGTDADSRHPGAPNWFEAVTSDVAQATDFYRELFGWTANVRKMPGVEYTVFKNRGTEIAGMMSIPSSMESVAPRWGTYFIVNDVDEAARVAQELGAKVHVPRDEIPGIGCYWGITSPRGVMFFIIQYLPGRAK